MTLQDMVIIVIIIIVNIILAIVKKFSQFLFLVKIVINLCLKTLPLFKHFARCVLLRFLTHL